MWEKLHCQQNTLYVCRRALTLDMHDDISHEQHQHDVSYEELHL